MLFTFALWKAQARQSTGWTNIYRINTIAFSRDGKVLVSGSADKTIRLWDAARGTELGRLTEHQAAVWSVAFSPDGLLLASGSEDKTIRLWDITNRRQVRVLGGDRAFIASVVFSPDGKLLASGVPLDKTIALWDVARAQEVRRWKTQSYVESIAFSPDGRSLVSTSAEASAPQFWDPATGEEIRPPRGHRSSVDWLAFSPDGTMLFSGGREQVILRWDLATGQERLVFASPMEESFARIILSPEGKVAATWSRSRTEPSIRLWEPVTGKELRMLGKHAWESDRMVAPWQALAFSTDGQRLITVDRERLVLWDPATGRQVREFLGLKGVIACVALSPDGRIVAGGAQGQDGSTIVLWDLSTGKQLRVVECRDGVMSLVFSPDSKRFATANGSDGPVRLWDVTTGKELYPLTRPAKGFNALAFSPNGRLLAGTGTVSPNRVYLWETLTGQEIRQLTSLKDEALSLAFAPDGKTLASGNGEGTILLWDVTGRWQDGPATTTQLGAKGLDQLWTDLGSEAATAYRAIAALVAAPQQAVRLLKERTRAVDPVDPQRLTQLIAALDSRQFVVRQKATEDLEKLAELAGPALRKALAGPPPTLEVRQRLERLLQKTEEPIRFPDTLRALRGLEVLEHIGTPEAQQVLEALAQGTPEARLTQEAKASLERLAQRPRTTP